MAVRGARETHKAFNPATANGVHYRSFGATSRLCLHCREWYNTPRGGGKVDYCEKPECMKLEAESHVSSRPVTADEAVAGWYEHIDSKPIYIPDRKTLYRECMKRGLQAKALMSGGVMKRPRGA